MPSFDRSVADSLSDGHGNYHIPGAQKLIAVLDDAMGAMLAPLALIASGSDAAAALTIVIANVSSSLFAPGRRSSTTWLAKKPLQR